ncbi:MAG: preprotein translocase subunit YajC [Synergistaceae bacterium]|nr:preprotein translocase subunit YajC [Synergistaceae bacterium]
MAEQTTPAVSPCGAPSRGGGNGGGGGAQGEAPGLGGMLFPIAVFILVFYFLILRPQNKRKKQQETMLGGITRGDQVITVSGVFGTVREVRDDTFMLEIAEGVKIRVLKSAVQTKRTLTPGQEKD